MKLLSIIGTRPQIIKALYMDEVCSKNNVEHAIIDTYQHYDHGLNDIFVEEKKAKVMYPFSALAELKLMEPDFVLIYGDTNSTCKAVAAGRGIAPIVHIEAGLRCWNNELPEEINRIYADNNSDHLMCPTANAILNVQNHAGAYLSGDILRDIFMRTEISDLNFRDYYVATIHREYNSDRESFEKILKILNSLDKNVVLPLHPKFKWFCNFIDYKNITVINPVNHSEMKGLLLRSEGCITDSGGVCRESYFGCIPCSVIRSEIEFDECIQTGGMQLIDKNDPLAFHKIMDFKPTRGNFAPTMFGNGYAAENIINHLGGICGNL